MCIICNCGDAGDEFLGAFNDVSFALWKARSAMLKCSNIANGKFQPERAPITRKRYDMIHKKIVRLHREWNAIEHEREVSEEDCEES